MQDWLTVMRELSALIRAYKIEAGDEKVDQATEKQSNTSLIERQRAITQINSELQKIKGKCDLLRQTVQSLPEKERIYAEQQIQSVIDKHFVPAIAELKVKKRKLSKP